MDESLQLAIEKANRLFDERPEAEWWGANIAEASAHLKKTENWTKFYAYLSAPHKFNPNEKLTTLADMDPMEIDWKYPPFMKEERYTNGNETTIVITNIRDECDEKNCE